jgi:hypothetical protein
MQRWREQYLGLAEFLPAIAIAEVDQFFTLSREELAAEVRVTAATFSDMEWFQMARDLWIKRGEKALRGRVN